MGQKDGLKQDLKDKNLKNFDITEQKSNNDNRIGRIFVLPI